MLIVENPDLLRRMGAQPQVLRAARAMRPRGGRGLGQLNYLPVGTQLVYTASVEISGFSFSVSQIGADLAQKAGIQIVGSSLPSVLGQLTGTGQVQITIQLLQAYTNAQMVQGVIDNELTAQGMSVDSSNIRVSNIPSQSSGTALISTAAIQPTVPIGNVPGAISTTTVPPGSPSWLSQNWPWLVGGGIAAIAGAYLLGRLL